MSAARPIAAIGIPTANRPQRLARTLQSLAQDVAATRPRPRVIVVDTSTSARRRQATRGVVEAARQSGLACEYVGPTAAGDPLDPGPFAADGWPATGFAGASRNRLLLLTAGTRFVMLDDDVLAASWRSPHARPGLVLGGHEEARDFRFFATRRETLGAIVSAEHGVCAAHAARLGRSVRRLVAEARGRVDVTLACAALLTALADGRRGRVRVTMTGVAGDAAAYCPDRLLLAGGTLRTAIWRDARACHLMRTSRETARIATTDRIMHVTTCMTLCAGIDNTSLVPPFPPMWSNEDGVFGALLGACDPHAVFAHLSTGVVHASGRPARYGVDDRRSSRECRVSDLLMAIIRQAAGELSTRAPGARLRQIGRRFLEVGKLPAHELSAFVVEQTRVRRYREFAAAAQVLAEPDCPAHWRRAFAAYRRAFERHAAHERFWLPIEYQRRGRSASGYRQLGSFLARFGDFLVAWPERWALARRANLGT